MKQPIEIRLRENKQNLAIAFSAAEMYTLSAELLRVESPSAEVQGHGKGEKRTVAGKKNVSITDIEPVGHYAVRLCFSDGHRTGLYTWEYLAKMGENQDEMMAEYVSTLESLGLSRD
jgi:DUF971 family protein